MSKTRPNGLTEPQWKLLREVVRGRTRTTSNGYRPAIVLSDNRLINAEPIDFGRLYVTPTQAGIDLVAKFEAENA